MINLGGDIGSGGVYDRDLPAGDWQGLMTDDDAGDERVRERDERRETRDERRETRLPLQIPRIIADASFLYH